MSTNLVPNEVISNYHHLGVFKSIDLIDFGLINQTFIVYFDTGPIILQQISTIFGPAVHEDFNAVSDYLAAKNILAPQIIKTDDGNLTANHNGQIFRAQAYINGISFHQICSPKMAFEAGKMLGTFHVALKDLDYEYKNKRSHGGDYNFHCQNLVTALKVHAHHDFFKEVEPLAKKMLHEMEKLLPSVHTTLRHAHGDPKISNLLFDKDENALCLVDFDTLGKTGWSLELADAMRSWTNKNKEDILDCSVDLEILYNSLNGYSQGINGFFSIQEKLEFLIHIKAITLCLSIRYLTDVLNEKYFIHDKLKYKRPAQHNILRANAAYNLYNDFVSKFRAIQEITDSCLK